MVLRAEVLNFRRKQQNYAQIPAVFETLSPMYTRSSPRVSISEGKKKRRITTSVPPLASPHRLSLSLSFLKQELIHAFPFGETT